MTTTSTALYSGPYTGNGANRVWSRDFLIHSATDMQVVHILATGEEITYPYSSGVWSVTGLGDDAGNVTFPLSNSTAAVTASESVRIERAFIETQDLDLSAQGAYDPARVEVAFDRRMFNELWLRDRTKRAITAPVGWTGNATLPTPQALYALGWDETGQGFANYPLPATVTGAAARAVVDATDLVAVGITIPLDGVQDAAPTLQAACDYLEVRGGALLTVRCPAGGGIRLNGRIRGATGVSINFVGNKVYVGANGGFALRGDPDLVPSAILSLASTLTAWSTSCVIDSTGLGASTLSSVVPAGSVIEITSAYDSAGTDKDRSRYTVTAVNNGTYTLTLNRGSDFTYSGSTSVRVETSSLLTADSAEFARTVAVADATKFEIGDYVLVEDHRACAYNGGGTINTPIRNETAKIIDISGNTLTLNRKLEHDFLTASKARVVKLNMLVGCEVSGAAIVLAEEADAYNHHIFDMRYARDCRAVDCVIDHDASFSRPSNNFRISIGTYDCEFVNCKVMRPRYYAEGEGYCFRAYGATKARGFNCYASGGRTGFICSNGATDIHWDSCWAHDQANKGFDCHGQDEYTVTCTNCVVDGSNVNNDGTRYALAPGNPTYLNGSKRFSFLGGRIRYQDSGDIVLYACPPSTDIVVSGVRMDKPYRVVSHFDINGGNNLVSSRVVIKGCEIFEPQEWIFYAEGKRFGSTVPTLDGVYFSDLYIEGGTSKLFNIDDIVFVWFDNIHFYPYDGDATYAYAMYADNVTDLRVTALRVANAKNGMSFANVDNFEVEARWRDPVSGTTVFNDRGGNSAGYVEWTGYGYTPTYGTPTGVTWVRCYPAP